MALQVVIVHRLVAVLLGITRLVDAVSQQGPATSNYGPRDIMIRS
jgi:hypothetical protein